MSPALPPLSPADPPPFEHRDGGSRVEAKRAGLDADVVRRLKKREAGIDARLDLHGLTLEDARVRLERFVGRAHGEGARVVLVIHGKGTHSGPRSGRPVLREEVPRWLSSPPLSHYVLAFTTAHVADGGEGALYLRLVNRHHRR
jgi:DNA-nicking Smr family endonuclease